MPNHILFLHYLIEGCYWHELSTCLFIMVSNQQVRKSNGMSDSKFHKGDVHDYIYTSPLSFIDSLSSCNNKHIVLYYENHEYSKKIQFKFIKNGLLNIENCIYITHDDNISSIENEMISHDIDVETFYEKGFLHIYKMPNLFDHPKGVMKGFDEFMEKILSGLKPPYRLVGRIIDVINTNEQIEFNLDIEKNLHSKFDQFNGILLCTYDVRKSPATTHAEWVENILNSHHSAIFVTDSAEQGIAFDMV